MGKQQIEDLNKEAYKQAEEELKAEKVAVVKDFVLKTLRKIDETKKKKELIEEQLRILNKDLEDLRNGDFSKMKEIASMFHQDAIMRVVAGSLPSLVLLRDA